MHLYLHHSNVKVANIIKVKARMWPVPYACASFAKRGKYIGNYISTYMRWGNWHASARCTWSICKQTGFEWHSTYDDDDVMWWSTSYRDVRLRTTAVVIDPFYHNNASIYIFEFWKKYDKQLSQNTIQGKTSVFLQKRFLCILRNGPIDHPTHVPSVLYT